MSLMEISEISIVKWKEFRRYDAGGRALHLCSEKREVLRRRRRVYRRRRRRVYRRRVEIGPASVTVVCFEAMTCEGTTTICALIPS